MARVIAIYDVGSNGCKVRLSDGRTLEIDHGPNGMPTIGDEFMDIQKPKSRAMTIEEMNGPAQVQANILSQKVKDAEYISDSAGSDGDRRTQSEEALQAQSGTLENEP